MTLVDQPAKTGRNDPCFCGSGKKYKKCCLANKVVPLRNTSNSQPSSGKILMTTTDELCLPARLYYEVFDKNGLVEQLSKLKCVDWQDDDHFFITYNNEAKNIGLSVPHKEVPKELYPIILAHGSLVNETQLYLDLRSFERATKMIPFIDKHIAQRITKVTHVATYNRMQTVAHVATDNRMQAIAKFKKTIQLYDYDKLFSSDNMIVVDPEKTLHELKVKAEKIQDTNEKIKMGEEYFQAQRDFRLIEKFPVYYYEEGIGQITFALNIRMRVAFKRWQGDVNYTVVDLLEETFRKEG